MAHRADQIIDAIVGILETAGISGVGKHRTLSYDIAQELPAVSVLMGQDAPSDDQPIPIIDSELTVTIQAVASADTEPEVVAALLALRTSTHIALMADRTLGLAFVSDTRYAGASAPEIDNSGERPAGRQETQWQVPYRMNLADPQ